MASITEQQVNIASKMYSCRKSLKFLFKVEYSTLIEEYKAIILEMQKVMNIDVIPAMTESMELYSDKPIVMMWFMAAAVEIIEPENAK